MKLSRLTWPDRKPNEEVEAYLKRLADILRKRDEEIRKVVNSNDTEGATRLSNWAGY